MYKDMIENIEIPSSQGIVIKITILISLFAQGKWISFGGLDVRLPMHYKIKFLNQNVEFSSGLLYLIRKSKRPRA